MFLVDNLLAAPGKALFFLFQELARKAQEEWLDDDSIKKELQEVYALLDSGQIEEKEFEARECRLLQRLEQIAIVKFQQKWGGEEASPVASPALPPAPVIEGELSARTLSDLAADLPPFRPATSPPIPQTNSAEVSGSGFGEAMLQALRSSFSMDAAPAPQRVAGANRVEAECSVRPLFEFELADPPRAVSEPLTQHAVAAAVGSVATDYKPQAPPPPVADRSVAPRSQLRPHTSESSMPATQPEMPRAPAATPAAAPRGHTVAMADVVDSAVRGLSLTKLKLSSVTSVAKAEDGWRVGIELVERAAVPDSGDLLGVYEVRLDDAGTVTRYERTRVRRRNDMR